MIRVWGVLGLLGLAFTIYCLLDVVLTDSELVRNLPKPVWVLVVLLVPLAGGVVWLLAGRPAEATAAPGGARSRAGRRDHPAGRARRPRPRPKGPDDDPEFLRRLDERLGRGVEDDESDEA